MNPTRLLGRAALLLASLAAMGATAQAPTPDARTMVECERAFARDAASKGMRAAFLAHLAESGIVFRPGPVLGRPWFEARPSTPALLAWEPWHAEISSSGDLGWTTGPWFYKRDSAQAGIDGSGEYVTLWRHDAKEGWRAVIDGGIGHAGFAPVGEPTTADLPSRPRSSAGPLARRETLWRADADFAKAAGASNTADAMRIAGAERVILLREGMPRVAGLLAAHDSLAARAEMPAMMSTAQFISEAGDLGYTYGSFVTATPDGPDSSWYMNIWRQGESRRWELALHLVMPGPGPKKP